MSAICQCPSCKAKYQVGDQYAGRTIKCPKCSAAVAVPVAAPPLTPTAAVSKASSPVGTAAPASSSVPPKAELFKARAVNRVEDPPIKPVLVVPAVTPPPRAVVIGPADTAADDPSADEAQPADEGLGFRNDGPAVRKRRAAPVLAERSSDENGPAEDATDDLASISALAAESSKGGHPHRSKKKKKDLPGWLIPAIAAVSVVALVAIGLTIHLTSKPKPNSAIAGSSAASDGKTPAKTGKPGAKVPVLTIDWPLDQRSGATLFINDDERAIPPTGPIEIPLPPSKEQYRFRLQRRGFQPKKFARASQDDDQGYTVSEWEPLFHGIDWEQDFEAAKNIAEAQHKNILIVFDASDSKESNFASSRFAEAIALRSEFRERASKEYVCIYIDNPKNPEAQGRVEKPDRNQELTHGFHISVFPTVVVVDPHDHPFGILEGYTISGINAFLEIMEQWSVDGKRLTELLAKCDAMPKGSSNADLVATLLDFLELNRLERFYGDKIKDLTARLPKSQGRVVTQEQARTWVDRFGRAVGNAEDAKKVVEEFDRWKKTRTFKDRDIGAGLHFAAALILARTDQRTEAAQKCKEGLAYEPRDSRLRELLERFSQALSRAPGEYHEMPVGSGTGFCIAEGGYVLTNHHVIDGAKKIKVRLNGAKTMYPASLVADNEDGDMALLKIALPEGTSLRPVPLVAKSIKTGQNVCALGFPEIGSNSTTPIVSQGISSSTPDSPEEAGFIVVDCRINPGNSGGPLCSFNRCIAGMVTAKSRISTREDSYGLVIPAARLRKFLVENLPADHKNLPAESTTSKTLLPEELNDRVSPSVVYIENIQ